MTTTSPLPEFKLTGVWLDHFLESEVPPIDLFWRFRENGGTGVILDSAGWPSPYQTTKVVEMTKDLGLQAIQMVSYRVLSNAATSKEQLDPLVRAIELADAVLLTFTNAEVFELLGQLPERPWLVLAGPQTELPQDFSGLLACLPRSVAGVHAGPPCDSERSESALSQPPGSARFSRRVGDEPGGP